MKILAFFFLLTSIIACDPYGFGFKKNPAYVLDEALKSVTHLDLISFLEVTGKEALCVYGNEKGLYFLKEKIDLNSESINIRPKVLRTEHVRSPKFVGYWSYYSERYEIEILDKRSEKLLLETIVDCEYGTDGQKSDKLINLKPSKYKMKECKVVKIIPMTFKNLAPPDKCNTLMIAL